MARYELVTTVYDNVDKKELAQVTVEESDDLEDVVAEFESVTDEDFDECRLSSDGGDDDDEADDDSDGEADSAS